MPLARWKPIPQPFPALVEERADRPADDVELNSEASFPASDPPSWTPVSRVGSPRLILLSPDR